MIVSSPAFNLSIGRVSFFTWHIRSIVFFFCCLFLCSCSTNIYNTHTLDNLTICQIWQDGHVLRDDNYGNISGFIIVPGSNYIVEVSHVNESRRKKTTRHGIFDSLLIELPDESCLTNSRSVYMPTNILYSAFTGRRAISIDTNSPPRAIVSILSCMEQHAMLDIDCYIPCIWYNPLHPIREEMATFEKHICIQAVFNIVDKHSKTPLQSPIVTCRDIANEH